MKLDEYLFRMKKTNIEFAQSLGISRTHLQSILAARRRPSVELAKEIEKATEGKVTKEELLFPEEYENKEV